MSQIPTGSPAFQKRNPHIFSQIADQIAPAPVAAPTIANPERIRQSKKPLMNKLETEFFNHLSSLYPNWAIHAQAMTFRLANGLRYTPDFVCISCLPMVAYEVKGKWVDGDSFPKLKMAASVYPEIEWILAWKVNGQWKDQKVLA